MRYIETNTNGDFLNIIVADENFINTLQQSTGLIYVLEDNFVHKQKELTAQELKALFISSIQNLLDSKAKEKNYDSILSACSYAGYDNPFRAEGEAYGVWRADCWQVGYQILAEVEAGTRPMLTIEEVLAEMPLLVLP